MLLTRSLPPQFLLPAWSPRRLAAALQTRAHECEPRKVSNATTKSRGHLPTWGRESIQRPEETARKTGRKEADHQTPERAIDASTPPQQSTGVHPEPSLDSLFEELFPEEKRARTRDSVQKAKKAARQRPDFRWMNEIYGETSPEDAQGKLKRASKPAPASRSEPPPNRGLELATPKRWPSVLVLNCALSSLEESDFFRLGPKGEHIEGWTSGLMKVIPGRDNQTLQSLDHYFILFTDEAHARAYMDNIFKLHRITRASVTHGQRFGLEGLPLPPGLLRNGQDVKGLVRGFSLVPPHSKLWLRLIHKPYTATIQRMLEASGPLAPLANMKQVAENTVLLYPDDGNISIGMLKRAIMDDGRSRNLHWKMVDDIVPLTKKSEGEILNEEVGIMPQGFQRPERYLIPFKDRTEARRFAREWHRRQFPDTTNSRRDAEPPIVNAEILW
ncbi:hypothetical protein BJ875DRAFT_463481 [Amylocarpus encephaloides]|uniref:Uncharacterized protein n=1 Tax=Amylocarpus encephaloides TaxID=45428 RepID=A0A9P7YHC0_9HELO|nr:hypothetical protein BJ875DRAFT_463481 [Amylocarpus encephaloides]